MRINVFTIIISAVTILALAGLGTWTYFAPIAKANPGAFIPDVLALIGILTSIVGTLFVSQWWVAYLSYDGGIRLRFYAIGSIMLASLVIITLGTVGFPYGFGVWVTAGLSLFIGVASFPDVTS